MVKERVKIPKNVEYRVIYQSEMKCYCGKRGDQIHHIDENPSNNDFDNLILLCYDHHDDASVKNGLRKRPSQGQLKKIRDDHYANNEIKRWKAFEHYNKTLKKITNENLYKAALDASIVTEIIKIKFEFMSCKWQWEEITKIITKLYAYYDYKSFKVSYEAILFLEDASGCGRAGMTEDFAMVVTDMAMNYFPYSDNPKDKKIIIDIAKLCNEMAFAIIYDAFIYLRSLAVAVWGFELLKYSHERGNHLNISSITENVLEKYKEIEGTLERPERNDLGNAKKLLTVYKNDLERRGLAFPDMPDDLFELIELERNKTLKN